MSYWDEDESSEKKNSKRAPYIILLKSGSHCHAQLCCDVFQVLPFLVFESASAVQAPGPRASSHQRAEPGQHMSLEHGKQSGTSAQGKNGMYACLVSPTAHYILKNRPTALNHQPIN